MRAYKSHGLRSAGRIARASDDLIWEGVDINDFCSLPNARRSWLWYSCDFGHLSDEDEIVEKVVVDVVDVQSRRRDFRRGAIAAFPRDHVKMTNTHKQAKSSKNLTRSVFAPAHVLDPLGEFFALSSPSSAPASATLG